MRALVVVVTDIFAVVGVAALRFAGVVVVAVVVFGVLVERTRGRRWRCQAALRGA